MKFSTAFNKNIYINLIRNAATFTPEYNDKFKGLVDELAKIRPQDVHKQIVPNGSKIRIPFDAKVTNEDVQDAYQNDKLQGKDRTVIKYLNHLVPDLRRIDYMDGTITYKVTKPDGKMIDSTKAIGKYLIEQIAFYEKEMKKYDDVKFQEQLKDELMSIVQKNWDKYSKQYDHEGLTLANIDLQLRNGIDRFDALSTFGYMVADFIKSEILTTEEEFKYKNIMRNWRTAEDRGFNLKDLLKTYQESDLRKNSNNTNLEIIISVDPHDIAQMSTNKSWNSCMKLPLGDDSGGGYHQSVFCSVAGGDVVAYLVSKDASIDENLDSGFEASKVKKDIKARLLIRNFTNKEGKSLFVPEGRVYGELSGVIESKFKEAVANYIISFQGSIPQVTPENYKMPAKEVEFQPNSEQFDSEYAKAMINAFKSVLDRFNGIISTIETANDNGLLSSLTDAPDNNNYKIMVDRIETNLYKNQTQIEEAITHIKNSDDRYFFENLQAANGILIDYLKQASASGYAENEKDLIQKFFHEIYREYMYFKQLTPIVMAQLQKTQKFRGYSDTFNLNSFESK